MQGHGIVVMKHGATEQPTNNPASLVLKLYQHPTLGKYAYTDPKIDLMKFTGNCMSFLSRNIIIM